MNTRRRMATKTHPALFAFGCAAPKDGSLWLDRVRDALALLCGGRVPPQQALNDWFDNTKESNELQDWAACNTMLHWAQGIVTIDAAVVLADDPEEGRQHLARHKMHKPRAV